MIGKSGSKMGSLVALLVMRISGTDQHIFARISVQGAAIPRRARSRSSRVSPNAPGRAPE
jgi:hypothetical protein